MNILKRFWNEYPGYFYLVTCMILVYLVFFSGGTMIDIITVEVIYGLFILLLVFNRLKFRDDGSDSGGRKVYYSPFMK